MNSPLVSIIVPTYNRSDFLLETLNSLARQTYPNFELVIVDDASTDETQQVLENFGSKDIKLQIIKRKINGGESAAVNSGWVKTKGQYVSIISSDDPQEPTWLEKMVQAAEIDPGHQFYYPNLRILDESGVVIQNVSLLKWSRTLIFQKLICVASAGTLIRKSNLPENFLPRDESITYPSDLIQFLELSKIGSGLRVEGVYGCWRMHSKSLTYDTDQVQRATEFHQNVSMWLENNWNLYPNRIQHFNAKINLLLQALSMIQYQYGKARTVKKVFLSRYMRIACMQPFVIFLIIPKLASKVARRYFLRFPKSQLIKVTRIAKSILQKTQKIIIRRIWRVINKLNYETFLGKEKESYAILRKKIDVKDFWEESHKSQSDLWLTGSDPEWLFRYHGVNGMLLKSNTKKKVLNVGVGKGTCTKALYETGHEIYALDISEIALNNISKFVKETYVASNLSRLPTQYFDLVLHHLVAQHMSIHELREQSRHLAQSLKPGGILCMQIATYEDGKRNDRNDSPKNCKKGSVGRSEQEIREIFNVPGVSITELSLTNTFPKYGSAWFRVKVTKN